MSLVKNVIWSSSTFFATAKSIWKEQKTYDKLVQELLNVVEGLGRCVH
jgi:hypothetical protein